MCGAELRPHCRQKYEPGPPSPQSIELGRVVDRGIRESGCIDLESLCVIPGESVYGVMVDIHVVNDSGNIFDASALAAIAALRTTIVPASKFDTGEDHPLKITKHPLCAHSQELAADLSWMQVPQKNWVEMKESTSLLAMMVTCIRYRRG